MSAPENSASALRLASGPADTSGKPKPPIASRGHQIRQLTLASKTLREVQKIIGIFNPQVITHDRRIQMLDDPTVAFTQAILRAPVVDDNFSIESEESKIAALVECAVREVWHPTALGMSRAIPLGYQAAEIVWKSGPYDVYVQDKSNGTSETLSFPNAWTYDRIKVLDQKQTQLLVDLDNDKWGGVRGMGVKDQVPVEISPERAMLWSFLAPLACGKLTGRPMLDQQYTPWYEKQATNLFCDRYFEKKADGSYKAHAPAEIDGPNGTKIDGFAFIQNALQALKNGEAITLPSEFNEHGDRIVDVEMIQDDKRGDMYHPRLEYLELQIAKGAMIADRAGSAGRGSGIGTGEAAVHFDILQMLLEEIIKDWLRIVQTQMIDPLVLYNFGEKALRSSRTRIKSKGISNWMRDLYRVVLQQMTQFEVALKDGKVVRCMEYIDFIAVCEKLGVPLKSADQLGPLAHARDDEAQGLKLPAGNPGDTNVSGKGGRKKKDGTGGGENS